MSIFHHSDYRVYLRRQLEKLPRRGRGAMGAIAEKLRLHPTVVSQIFSGSREFHEEHALELAEFFGLDPLETKFLRMQVRHANAGTQRLRSAIAAEMQEMKEEAQKLVKRLPAGQSLSEEKKGVFYSSWIYPACRLFCSTGRQGKTAREVADRFRLSLPQAKEVLDFLASCGLCERKGERFAMGAQKTFVERGAPHFSRHHANWHLKSMQRVERATKEELLFSAAHSISRRDFARFRARLDDLLQEFYALAAASEAEEVACLNLDYFVVED